jgi:hypothetical protein
MVRIGFVMEAAVGERTAEALVEEQEQERDVNSLGRQSVSVAATVAFEQSMAFEFAEIVTKLVESVLFRGKLERGDDGRVNLFGGPAADSGACE